MNRLIYFVVLILFLIMIKQLVFMDEGFHVLSPAEIEAAETAKSVAEAATKKEAEEVAVEVAAKRVVAEAAVETAQKSFDDILVRARKVSEALVAATATAIGGAATATDGDALKSAKEKATVVAVELKTAKDTLTVALETVGKFPVVFVSPILHTSTSEEHKLNPIKTVEVKDKECCGVTIYDVELKNIGKCVTQHIKQDISVPANPTFAEWNDLASESECKNPHRIISRTSNCKEIVNTYEPSIQTLLTKIKRTGCEQCDYLRYLQEEKDIAEGSISANDKLWIFQNRRDCSFRNLNEEGISEVPIGDQTFKIKKCGSTKINPNDTCG